MPGTTPRQDVRAAFKTILSQANLGVTIHDRMPYEGAEPRSVVLTIVSGSSRRPAIGNRLSSASRALEDRYRLQVDCFHDDKAETDKLADKVEQAIFDRIDTLESTYEIYDVRKIVDTDVQAPEPMLRESRVLMDFEFYIHRTIT